MPETSSVTVGKETTLRIWNEDLEDIIETIKSLENSGVFIDGISKKAKNEIKSRQLDFLVCQ